MQLMRRANSVDAPVVERINLDTEVFGAVGVVLGGREQWKVKEVNPEKKEVTIKYLAGGEQTFVRDDYDDYSRRAGLLKWYPASSMPKFTVRIFLEVKQLHVHRLMNLAEEDAQAMGITKLPARDAYFSWYRCEHGRTNFQFNEWQIRAEVELLKLNQNV